MRHNDVKILEGTTIVEWSEPRKLQIAIGCHQCSCCERWTPTPSDRALIDLYERGIIQLGMSTVWPFDPCLSGFHPTLPSVVVG